MMVRKARLALAGFALLAANVAVPAVAQAQASSPTAIVPGPTPVTRALGLPAAVSVAPQTMVADLEAPWGLAFLPNGDLLVTELLGKLRYVKAGTNWSLEAEEIKGVPTVTAQTIFEVTPAKPRFQHFGSRFTWLPDQTLLISIGDGGNPPNSLDGSFIRNQAQNLGSHLGKIVRIKDDGSIPKDNPFLNTPGARPEIYSYGHRNSQGLARDPVSGRIYATEHGSQGGDELNLIQSGQNYGWPKVTYAVEYGAARTPITPNQSGSGLVDPLAVWSPAIAPSGLAVVRSSKYRGWDGDLLAGGLRLDQGRGALIRVDLDKAGKVLGQERIDLGDVRVRDVRQGPDGYIYVLTTAMRNFRDKGQRNGQLVRLLPATEVQTR